MKVVAVVNNKGGVGKTTVTANLGAGLARAGMRVLMIDLDPQASLTKSFFTVQEAQDFLAKVATIGKWFESPDRGRAAKLASLIVSPPRFNRLLSNDGGWLELIPSDSRLIDAEVLIPKAIDRDGGVQTARFLPLHRRLRDDLDDPQFDKYDVVLIDCAPNFLLPTKMAAVACDFMVIPTRPDFLSTEGVQDLGRALQSLVGDYNKNLRAARGNTRSLPAMTMPNAAVLFTMVELRAGRPIDVHGQFIEEVKALRVPVFDAVVRDRSVAFAAVGRHGVPTIMAPGIPQEVREDLHNVVAELVRILERL